MHRPRVRLPDVRRACAPPAPWRRAAALALALTAGAAHADQAPPAPRPFLPHVSLLAELGVSVDQGAGAVGLGVRFNLAPRLILGAQAEWNPWFDILSGATQVGAFNAFAVLGWRWLLVGAIDAHTTVCGGVSVLLFDALGPYAGATGVRFGFAPVGVGIGLGDRLRLEVQPEVVLAAPQLRGTPLVHHQYRISLSLAWASVAR